MVRANDSPLTSQRAQRSIRLKQPGIHARAVDRVVPAVVTAPAGVDRATRLSTESDASHPDQGVALAAAVVASGADERVADALSGAQTSCWQPKSYESLGVAIDLPEGTLPHDQAAECLNESRLVGADDNTSRGWPLFHYNWVATCFCHRPLYFQEANLERHGYTCPPIVQPAVSAAHFFGTVPALPYLMAVDCPNECVYTLGQYRPGSCVPWRHQGTPVRTEGALAQGGVVTGLIFLIP